MRKEKSMSSKFPDSHEETELYTRLRIIYDYLKRRESEWEALFALPSMDSDSVDKLRVNLEAHRKDCEILLNRRTISLLFRLKVYTANTYQGQLQDRIEMTDKFINILNRIQIETTALNLINDVLDLISIKKTVTMTESNLVLTYSRINEILENFQKAELNIELIQSSDDL
jgi:hypothetical protein